MYIRLNGKKIGKNYKIGNRIGPINLSLLKRSDNLKNKTLESASFHGI